MFVSITLISEICFTLMCKLSSLFDEPLVILVAAGSNGDFLCSNVMYVYSSYFFIKQSSIWLWLLKRSTTRNTTKPK